MVDDELSRNKGDFLDLFKKDRIGVDPQFNQIENLIANLSPEARAYMSFLTSTFLEKDVQKRIMGDWNEIEKIKNNFKRFGVADSDSDKLVNIFKREPEDSNK